MVARIAVEMLCEPCAAPWAISYGKLRFLPATASILISFAVRTRRIARVARRIKESVMGVRRFVAPVVVAAAVAGGGVAGAMLGVPGISGAQENTQQEAPAAGTAARDGALKAAADALGLSVTDLATALRGGKTIAQVAEEKTVDVNTVIDAMVAAAVNNGRDEAKAREVITKLVNEGPPAGHHGRHPRLRHAVGTELDAAAQALGMDRSALVQELEDGKTIAQVAEERTVDVNTVIDAMVAPVKERITKFVNEGRPDHGE
jgi:hypothetical protein